MEMSKGHFVFERPPKAGRVRGTRRNNVLLLPPPRQRFNHFPLERLAFFLVSVKKLA